MKWIHPWIVMGVWTLVVNGFICNAQSDSLRELVATATDILDSKQGSLSPIPVKALQDAKGVAILSIIKAGFGIGGVGGDGVVIVKQKGGFLSSDRWGAPIPVSLSGGSIGAQIGVETAHIIVLLNSDSAVRIFTRPGKLEWNATATGTAGAEHPKEGVGGLFSGRDVTIYKETDGLYGGAVFGGAALSIKEDQIADAYGDGIGIRDILDNKAKAPEYANRLYLLLNGKR